MKLITKLEQKFGRYGIHNLTIYIIICYVVGYVLQLLLPNMLAYLALDPGRILQGQVWRLFTWILIPPNGLDIFTIIMLYFYYSLGTTLERTWGVYRYNVYIFSGVLFTILGAFLLFAYTVVFGGDSGILMWGTYQGYSPLASMFSTYYVNMSIFLAFAATYPNMQVLLFFIIPIKIKILGIIYGALLIYQFAVGGVAIRFVIAASLMNFIVFFLTGRGRIHMSPKQVKRRQEFKREVKKTTGITRHKCAICGRTEETNPELEFRFCSKCDGNYEYCQDHLFTHTHVKHH